jgi:hypothetical protein
VTEGLKASIPLDVGPGYLRLVQGSGNKLPYLQAGLVMNVSAICKKSRGKHNKFEIVGVAANP